MLNKDSKEEVLTSFLNYIFDTYGRRLHDFIEEVSCDYIEETAEEIEDDS